MIDTYRGRPSFRRLRSRGRALAPPVLTAVGDQRLFWLHKTCFGMLRKLPFATSGPSVTVLYPFAGYFKSQEASDVR